METLQNRRKDDRYFIDEIPLEGIGSIVEVSKNGLKIKKAPGFTVYTPALTFNISNREINADVRWEDRNFIGLQLAVAFSDPAFIIKRTKKAKEEIGPPQMSVSEKAILQYEKDEVLTSLVNLLLEIESPEPNVTKIGIYIAEICTLEEKKKRLEEKGEGQKDAEQSFKDTLIARAVSIHAHNETEVSDIHFAITTLGLDNVREIVRNYVHRGIFQSKTSLSAFQDFGTFNILKSSLFKNLCRLFGFLEIQQEGNALLSFETAGVEILVRESSGILDSYYKSPSRLYSEISRMYEKTFFGIDPLEINRHYFDKGIGSFGELYNGYVLAHTALNTHYSPSEDLKLSLTKNGLIFSSMAYLTFLAVDFLMDKDKESGFLLKKRLRGKGMDDEKILNFLDESIGEAKTLLKDFAVKGSIIRPPLPAGSMNIEGYVGKDVRFEYLVRSFRNFERMDVKRMALRYEDDSYAHFILGKFINSDRLELNSKTLCVVPCRNVSNDQWYVTDFSCFDLLVFKDINKLPDCHLNAFIKLWNSFEGRIIATFSYLDFLDFTAPRLHSVLKSHIVDFPSYFFNDIVYKKMVAHTVNYLEPYIGGQQIDLERYLNEVYTMNHIKTDILLNKEIV